MIDWPTEEEKIYDRKLAQFIDIYKLPFTEMYAESSKLTQQNALYSNEYFAVENLNEKKIDQR